MADNINFNSKTGRYGFASKREVAWHGLGQIVDAMTSEEAIELGGLNFTVEKRPLFITGSEDLTFDEAKKYANINRTLVKTDVIGTPESNSRYTPFYHTVKRLKGKYATVRTDTDLPLGIVGSRYEIIQNTEAFDFFDSIIGEGHAAYETVGCLGNGETVFITAKLREEMVVNKELIDNYLLLSMSHDGSSSITVMFTPIRVVCNNTLKLALLGGKNKVIIRHTKTAKDKLEASKEILGIVGKQRVYYKELFTGIGQLHIPDEKANLIIEKSLGIVRDDKGNLSTKANNILKGAIEYYNVGIGQSDIVGTGWGVYNGITGYLQNVKEYKDEDTRFKNTILDDNIRNKAYNFIVDEV